jgi:thiosulfate dehydrogenase
MKPMRTAIWAVWIASGVALAGCQRPDSTTPTPTRPPAAQPRAAPTTAPANAAFAPPAENEIPSGPFGDMVRRGRDIFTDTGAQAAAYVGNGLACSNCHLDAGRLPNSAPLWGAYVRYPAYRSKTGQVNDYIQRVQGCFVYSMNGKAPPADSPEMLALEAYSFWLSTGAPVGATLAGAGYPKMQAPQPPDYRRGERVYQDNCALCHGKDGQGQAVAGRYVFPPLWGPDSFNWGAGMHQLDNAAAFIQANMPFGRGGSLDKQQAWDVAMFVDAHERPQDPRFTGDIAATRRQFHDNPDSLYGTVVDGRLLGARPSRPAARKNTSVHR